MRTIPEDTSSIGGETSDLSSFMMRSTPEDQESKVTEIHLAALVGELDIVKELIQNGSDPNGFFSGRTPLHFVMGFGTALDEEMIALPEIEKRIQILKLLLEAGSKVDSRDSSGRTPLMTCIRSSRRDNVKLARILLEHGADPLLQDKEGHTPFHHACDFKRLDIFALLVEYGPSVPEFPIGEDRRTLLHLAALCSKPIFQTLLESTPVDFINSTCVNQEGMVLDEMLSLPCCLIQNRNLDGLEALLNKEGVNTTVLTCPVVSELCRGVYSPVAFAFVKDTFSEFSFQAIQLYGDRNLPLDPNYTEEVQFCSFGDTDVLSCLEILVDVHEFHMGNNLENSCKCAHLYILLLKNGARLEAFDSSSNDKVSTRVLKFLCTYGSVFGLVYLLKYSSSLEPKNVLKCFVSLAISFARQSVIKHKSRILNFLTGLCSPDDIKEIREHFSLMSHPGLDSLMISLCYNPVNFPTLKNLSRNIVRKQCHSEYINCTNNIRCYIALLPLPKPLISFLEYGDLEATLKCYPDYPSFVASGIS